MAKEINETAHEFEQEVTCSICHDHYQEPKLLPCCHYYCKQCILSLSSRYPPNQPFPCPDCREPTLLPGNDPNKLPTAFFINRMKVLHSRMEKAHGKLEVVCEMCSSGKATAFCRQCVNFICEECVKSHQRLRVFAGHNISTLEELKQGGAKGLATVEVPLQKCSSHDEPRKIFCYDCKQLICRDCLIFDHVGHKSEFVKKAAPEYRKKLVEHLFSLKNMLPDMASKLNQVSDAKQEIRDKGKLIEKEVNDKFQELHDILDECKARLLRESCVIVEQKAEKLTAQEKATDLSMGYVQNLIDFIERTLENASNEELITMQEQVLNRIDAEVVKREQETSSTDPVETANFGAQVFISKGLTELCENNVVVYEGTVDPVKCTVELDGAQMVKVGTSSSFLLSTKQPDRFLKSKVVLNSLVDHTSLKLEPIPVKKGLYSVEYIPTVRGEHHLLISVDGQTIPGSPFSVHAEMPPTKLDKPVREITYITSSQYVAFNSEEEMVATEYSGDVMIFNWEGEKLRKISKLKHKFGNICGVAVDKEDQIFVSDFKNNCIYKFTKDGKLLKKFGKHGSGLGEFKFPRGLAFSGDRLFVCDRDNNRVQVLTADLVPVQQFGSKGAGYGQFDGPESVAVDSTEGLLYVSDWVNHRVQVFNVTKGQFVRSFGRQGHRKGELNYPEGVCIHAGHVYVVERNNNRVSVFTKDGQFVTSFGLGHITTPFGVSVDSDGFVYVCSSKSIVVF